MTQQNDKLARPARGPAAALMERVARSPLGGLMPDVLSATLSIAASSGADPMGLVVAMMSGFAGVYAPSSAKRVEVALMEFARELAALDEHILARDDMRDEEFLHLLRDLIVHSGRTPGEEDRARLRRVLIHGIRERHAPARTRLFFDLATRLGAADVELLASLERPLNGEAALASTVDVTGLALLEREGLAGHGTLTALGAQFLTFTQG